MRKEITRPKAEDRKISSKNEFELCYMRHQYFRRSTYNPTVQEMAPYMAIVNKKCKNAHFVHSGLFSMVGFEKEDLVNIGMIHLVSFLGLFSMEMMPEKYHEYVEKFMLDRNDPPSEDDVLSKNKANFTVFLKQRLAEVIRICRQKVRNIKGAPFEEFQPFYGPRKPPADVSSLLTNYEVRGFRKMDIMVFKTIRRKAKARNKIAFRYEKMWYIIVPITHKKLHSGDFSGAGLDPHDNMHNMNPEEILSQKQEDNELEKFRKKFKRKSKEEQASMYAAFINKHKNNNMYVEEVETAKRSLMRIKGS